MSATRTRNTQARSLRPSRGGTAVAALTSIGLAFGCAAPPDMSSVDRARIAIERAQGTGLVASDSLDFREAQRHYGDASRMAADHADQALIDHSAEMAALYAEVAVARAEATAAQAEADAYLNRAQSDTATTRVAVELAILNARAIDAQRNERGLVLTLGGVLFATGSAELTEEAKLAVARVAGFLIALNDREAVVEGHADSTGSADFNLALSGERAASIRKALVEFGVEPDRLAAHGYGSQFPVASNDTAEGRARNRRVEIVILEPGVSAESALR